MNLAGAFFLFVTIKIGTVIHAKDNKGQAYLRVGLHEATRAQKDGNQGKSSPHRASRNGELDALSLSGTKTIIAHDSEAMATGAHSNATCSIEKLIICTICLKKRKRE